MPAGAEVVDRGSPTVFPGLIGTHTDIFLQGEDPAAGGYDVQLLKYPAAFRAARAVPSRRVAHLNNGNSPAFATWSTEGAGYGDVGIKQAINEGIVRGPRMWVTTSHSLPAAAIHWGYAPEIVAPRLAAHRWSGRGAQSGPATTRSWRGSGQDLHVASFVARRPRCVCSRTTLTVEVLKAIVDANTWVGHGFACHAYNGPGLQRALDGGCDSIEHGLEITDTRVAQMVKQGTWYVQTLQVYYTDWDPEDTDSGRRDRKRVAVHGVSFNKALRAGVKIAFGTDVGGFAW